MEAQGKVREPSYSGTFDIFKFDKITIGADEERRSVIVHMRMYGFQSSSVWVRPYMGTNESHQYSSLVELKYHLLDCLWFH